MTKLSQRAATQTFVQIPELVPHPSKGIESRHIVEKLEELYGMLNDQANQLDDWREHVIQLLTKPLVDEEDDVEITGEEFVESTLQQEELMAHVDALRASIADRQDAINGQTNELIRHEVKVARQQAKNGEGHVPELRLKLLDIRDKIKPSPDHGSIRAAIAELRALNIRHSRDAGTGSSRSTLEYSIVSEQMKTTQAHQAAQDKAAKAMELELELFTAAMNARVDYYRQLQAISDSVSPYEGPNDGAVMNSFMESEQVLRKKLETAESKHRYREYMIVSFLHDLAVQTY
jgi:E3 ubiquitin-protein ligase SHPRH